MEEIKVRITGTTPLLMHNGISADPLSAGAKKLASISTSAKKSEKDHLALQRIDFENGLYFDEKQGPYLSDNMIYACIHAGAKKFKLGATMLPSVVITNHVNKLDYDGPRTVAGLYKKGFFDRRMVKVSTARVARTRPMFKEWSCDFDALVSDDLGVDKFMKSVSEAGRVVGIGDYRPKFGRFVAELVN